MSKTIGNAFEQRALEYLQRQRLRFIARNFVCRGGEIDLVMRETGSQRALVFVEVRAAAQPAIRGGRGGRGEY